MPQTENTARQSPYGANRTREFSGSIVPPFADACDFREAAMAAAETEVWSTKPQIWQDAASDTFRTTLTCIANQLDSGDTTLNEVNGALAHVGYHLMNIRPDVVDVPSEVLSKTLAWTPILDEVALNKKARRLADKLSESLNVAQVAAIALMDAIK